MADSRSNGIGNWRITNVWVVDFDSTGGDSGGPYVMWKSPAPGYTAYGAAGLHIHSSADSCTTKCRGWYSTTDRIENKLSNMKICVTAGC